jgi:predicted MPP superfamily phosphohydrolase
MTMWPLLPLPETTVIFAATSASGACALGMLEAGKTRATFARAGGTLAAITALGLALWAWGSPGLAARGVWLAWTCIMLLAPLAIALFGSATLQRAARSKVGAASPARRAFLQAGAAALPVGTMGVSGVGFSAAQTPPRIPLVRLRFPELPPDLDGLRILHLSDLHLGAAMHARDLEALLERAAPLEPDLVVLTGDVADDLHELREALAIVHRHRPRFGVFAALGNHEYLHDIRDTLPIYQRSQVPLLLDRGTTLEVGAARLFLAGVDDPYGKGDPRAFYEHAVARASASAPEDAFRVLLCHRPEGFVAAASQGFDLTLSGHTHGGQVGLFGVSAFQVLFRDAYLWGAYERAGKRLYTTSGFGHWFPFRLGCPAEAPIIVLERG